MRVACRDRGRRSRGAVLIEFVIVLPVFLVLVLGSIDWGWYFILRQTAVNATREGARAGSVAPADMAAADARVAVHNYLTNSLGEARVMAPLVKFLDVGGRQAISVSLDGFPAGSVTGFTLSQVPATINATTVMRLEVQP